MKIVMLVDVKNKVNGKNLGVFVAGKEYEVSTDIGTLFIGSAMAEKYIPPAPVKTEKA